MTPAREDLIERIRRLRAAREAGDTTVPGGAPQDPGTRTPTVGEPDDPVVRVRELVVDRLARRQRRPLEELLEAMPRPEPVAGDVATAVLPAASDTIPTERALPPQRPVPQLRATPESYEADPDRARPAPPAEPATATPPARRDPTDSASAPWDELQSALSRAAVQDATRQPSPEKLSELERHRRQREAAAAYARSLTPGERIMHAGRAFAQSIGHEAANFVAGLPVLAKTIDDILAHAPVITPRGGSDKIMAQRTRFIQAAQAIRGWAERTFPTDPNLQHAFLETLLPQGLGSFTTYLGVSVAGTAAGGPVGGILAGGVFGSSAGAAQAYLDALEHGADEETAVLAGELGAVVGASELVPVLRALNRFGLSKLSPAIRGKLARALWEGSKGAVEEALQEAGANTAYNLIARELYDHDRSLAEGLIEAGEVGGAVGFISNFLMAAIPGRRRRVRQPGEDAAADPDALDPYAVLGVSPNATDEEINAAFRRRVKDVHPDVNPSPEAAEVFATLVEARDAIRRERAARAAPEEPPVAEPAEPAPETPAAEPAPEAPADVPEMDAAAARRRASIRRKIAEIIDPELRRREAEMEERARRAEDRAAAAEAEVQSAFRDTLTGLPNPSAFERARPRLDADETRHWLAIDLTFFKDINDRLGREAGDNRLREVAAILREEAEKRGVEFRDIMRAGGDEFAVSHTDRAVLEEIGRAVMERVPELDTGTRRSHVRFGIGATWYDADADAQAKKATEDRAGYRGEPEAERRPARPAERTAPPAAPESPAAPPRGGGQSIEELRKRVRPLPPEPSSVRRGDLIRFEDGSVIEIIEPLNGENIARIREYGPGGDFEGEQVVDSEDLEDLLATPGARLERFQDPAQADLFDPDAPSRIPPRPTPPPTREEQAARLEADLAERARLRQEVLQSGTEAERQAALEAARRTVSSDRAIEDFQYGAGLARLGRPLPDDVLHAVRLGYEWQQEQQRAAAVGQPSAAEQAVMPILINAAQGDAARARRALDHARKVGAANPALYALGRLDAMRGADRRADADPSYLQGYDDLMRELEPGLGTPAAAESESAPAPTARRRSSERPGTATPQPAPVAPDAASEVAPESEAPAAVQPEPESESPEPDEAPVVQATLEAGPRASEQDVHRLFEAALNTLRSDLSGLPTTPTALTTWAENVLGKSYAEEAFSLDDVYDAIEGAANAYALEILGPLDRPGAAIEPRLRALRDLENALFHKRSSSAAMKARQQYSTPLPIAEAAMYAAGVRPGVDKVLEPSAGTGNLVNSIRTVALRTDVNEIDPRRVAVLRALGLNPTTEDALRLPLTGRRYNVVITNPPYGSIRKGRYSGFGAAPFPATDIAQRFFAQAMGNLEEGGRIVAVMPRNTILDQGIPFRTWLRENHTPIAYIESPEGSYLSRGVRSGSVIVVVDKGKRPNAPDPLIVRDPTWDEWFDAIAQFSAGTPYFRDARGGPAEDVAPTTAATAPARAEPAARPQAELIDRSAGDEAESPVPEAAPPAQETDPVADAAARIADAIANALESRLPQGGTDVTDAPTAAPERGEGAERPGAEPAGRAGTAYPDRPAEPVGRPGPGSRAGEPGAEVVAEAEPEQRQTPERRAAAALVSRGARRRVEARPTDSPQRKREIEAANRSAVFAPYAVGLESSRNPHPRLVVETRAMAGMPAPEITARIMSPQLEAAWGRDGARGGVSDEQVDAILRVLSAWEAGHGFLLSDDVGVGKSREAAGLILEALARGKKRILYTTKNANNVADAIREFRLVATGSEEGAFPAAIVDVADYPAVLKGEADLPVPDGPVVYIAHSYNFRRVADALEAVNPEVWIADEAHEYKNVAGSDRGLAWAKLHAHMLRQDAQFAYLTATPAVTLNEIGYLYGLKLWPVGGFTDWLDRKLGKAGVAKPGDQEAVQGVVRQMAAEDIQLGERSGVARDLDEASTRGKKRFMAARNDAFANPVSPAITEQVMREMKGSGHYISRDLWRGGIEFSVEEIDLLGDSPEARAARERYNEAAALVRDITMAARRFGRMNKRDKTGGLERSQIQAYMKQLLFELRLPRVLELAGEALEEGKQVVISVHSVAGDEVEDDVGTLNTRLESAINAINTQHVEKTGTGEAAEYVDLGEIPEALAVRAELLDRLSRLPPLSDPIKVIEDAFGAKNVAAITGRATPKKRAKLMAEFQAGKRSVAIISKAGKVGISLHDVNGRRRRMIVADYEWSADLFKQELGRVDRTGQRTSPEIMLVASNVGGERKFAATIAARMASLGATSKGSAESTGTDALDQFDMSGDIPLNAMRNAIEVMPDPDRQYFTGSQFLRWTKQWDGSEDLVPVRRPNDADMRSMLLEILMFPVEAQERLMQEFLRQRDALLTGEAVEALAARRTARAHGEVLRVTELIDSPPIVMYEIKNAAGERRAIIQGFVTEHIADIQRVRGPDSSGRLKPTRYVQFTSNEGELITGLEIAPGEARRILDFYNKATRTEITPEDAYSDLIAGDKVPVHGPAGEQWLLHPRRDGRIQIMGATLAKHQDVLRPLGVVAYDQRGNFLFLKGRGEEELTASLRTFLERFPPVVETQVVDDVDDAEGALAEAGVEYDPTDESVPEPAAAPSARELALPFYSRLERAVLRAPQDRATAQQWRAWLSAGVSGAEREYVGVHAFLDAAERAGVAVTRAELLDLIRTRGIALGERRYDEHVTLPPITWEEVEPTGSALRRWEARTPAGPYAIEEIAPGSASYGFGFDPRGEAARTRFLAYDVDGQEHGFPTLEAAMAFVDDDVFQLAGRPRFEHWTMNVAEQGENYREIVVTLEGVQGEPFTAGEHWPGVENPVGHIRLIDRLSREGERILHVEEVQSDWSQRGREYGFRSPELAAELEAAEARVAETQGPAIAVLLRHGLSHLAPGTIVDAAERGALSPDDPIAQLSEEELEAIRAWKEAADRARELRRAARRAMPATPYARTDDWAGLLVRRALIEAVGGEYDRVAFTTGAEQADRYSLRRYIDRIEYTPLRDESGAPTGRYNVVAFADARYPIHRERGASLERIADVFGRAIAERIREGDGHRMDPDTESRALTGVDLEVGGEGMLKFYDEILPRIVEKELRRLGVNQKVDRDAVHLTGRTNWREVWNGPALTDEVLDRAEALLVSGTMQKAAGMGRLSKMDGIAAARDVIQPLRERASTPQEREKMLTQNRAAFRATHYQFENAFAALGGQVEIVADDTPVALPSIRVTPELREAIRSEGAMLLEPEMDYDARALADEQNIAWEGGKDEADRMAREIARRNPKEGIFTVNGQPSTARRLLVAGRKSLKTAAVNLRGQVVRRAEDLHRALWTARHPRMEILHIILMDDEGRVHSHVMETSGHVSTVSVWGRERRSAQRFAWEIAHRAQRTGATRVLIAHNHPSGVPTPSDADRTFSRTVSALLEPHGLEFVGQYIINDSRATFLVTHPDGSVEEIPVSVDMRSVGDWTEHLGPDIIRGPNHLASLIRGVSDPTRFDVVYITSHNQIVAVEPHRPEAVRTMLHWLPAHGRALGSDRAFIVVDGAAQPGLYEQISDLVAQNRAALREVLDVVDMAQGGVRRTARREQRFDKPPKPPRTPALRLRESEAEYDPWTEEVTRAGVRPAARTVSGALELGRIGYEFLADDLINVVRKQGRGGERFAARAERATQSTKSVMGRLAARAKRTLKLVSASPAAQRASWYLQQIQWDGPSGFARIQPVLEGTIPEKRLPARVREWARGQWRLQARMAKMAEDLGILQPLWVRDEETGMSRLVLRRFKGRPGGRIALRMATPYLVDMYMNPRGEAWETYVAEIARLNGWEVPEAEERIREFTERKFRRTHAEIPRLIPVHPTHLRVGGRVIPLLETHPYAYTAASIRSFAHRYGFIREFGQSLDPNADLMEQLRDQAVQDGVDPRTIDNLLKALSGIPLEGPLPAVRPGSAAHEAIAQMQRLVAMVRAGMLTRAAIPNLPEPLGNLQAFGGARRLIQALIDLAPGRYADTVLRLERMGLTAADVANLTIDRDRYLASLSRIWGQSVLRLFGTKPAWEFGEKLAAAQGLRFAQDLMAARGGRFTREMSWLTLRALGYTKRDADRLTYEMPNPEFSDVRLAPASVREAYIGVAQRFATRLINSTMTLPAEESRSANSRYWKAWIWFDSYFQMNARTSARSLRNLWEALGTARENPHRLGAALYQLARLHAGKTAAGSIAYALLLFALGGSYGLGQAAREAKEDPLDFLLRAWLYTQFGPIVMSLARVFESRRVEDWRLVSAPVSLIEEVASMVMGWGAYRDLSPIERASRFGDRYFTVKRSIAQFMAAYGLSEEDPKLRAAIREYWAWRRRHDLAPGRYEAGDMEAADREFRRHMRRAYEAMQLEEPDPDEVLRHINRALQAEGKDWSSVAQSLRARRLLTQLDETQREALREYLGEEMYAVLEAHDAVLEAWASAGSRQRRDRRRTRRQSSR